jgi:hypothetical protein
MFSWFKRVGHGQAGKFGPARLCVRIPLPNSRNFLDLPFFCHNPHWVLARTSRILTILIRTRRANTPPYIRPKINNMLARPQTEALASVVSAVEPPTTNRRVHLTSLQAAGLPPAGVLRAYLFPRCVPSALGPGPPETVTGHRQSGEAAYCLNTLTLLPAHPSVNQ